jgi:hypothetical protein
MNILNIIHRFIYVSPKFEVRKSSFKFTVKFTFSLWLIIGKKKTQKCILVQYENTTQICQKLQNCTYIYKTKFAMCGHKHTDWLAFFSLLESVTTD